MQVRDDLFLWSEKYRPRKVEDAIIAQDIKADIVCHVKKGSLPNMLFTGPAGTGKTTVARAACEELGADYYFINGSLKGNIDTLRNDIAGFASSVSWAGGRKYVIVDEADGLNPTSTQPALRGFIEEFSGNCGFILTCNYKEKILLPLRSRMAEVDFKPPVGDERATLAGSFFKRVLEILTLEKVEHDAKAVAELVMRHFPDCRRVLNELQRHSGKGSIGVGILAQESLGIDELVEYLKKKDFSSMRRWVAERGSTDTAALFRELYDGCDQYLADASSKAELVVIIGDYQYYAAFVADLEVNMVACLARIMSACSFK